MLRKFRNAFENSVLWPLFERGGWFQAAMIRLRVVRVDIEPLDLDEWRRAAGL